MYNLYGYKYTPPRKMSILQTSCMKQKCNGVQK